MKRLPGCPDIVLAKYKTVIFVQGCFWHMLGCERFHWPATNLDYWRRGSLEIYSVTDRTKNNYPMMVGKFSLYGNAS